MADDDNFDIDIYGDDAPQESFQQDNSEVKQESNVEGHTESMPDAHQATEDSKSNGAATDPSAQQGDNKQANGDETQQISSTGGSSQNQLQPPRQAPVAQGVKRKEGADDRPVDQNATTALLISDLHWWTNEDDVRGWTNQSGCEDELVEITFNEHKVNGKSKGQCFVELSSPQAATALKRTIESFGQGQQYAKKHGASYHAPHINPYRTLPKDVPNRKDGNRSDNRSASGSFGGNSNINMGSSPGGGFRGGRGGFNRGGMNSMGYNRGGFNNPMGGGGMGPTGGYGNPMGGFGGNPMAMNNMGFNSNFNRGGMMGGMRGGMGGRGRGGLNTGMNPGMMGGMGPMGGMGMNPGMMGGMGGMGGNMNMGMGGMAGQYNSTPAQLARLHVALESAKMASQRTSSSTPRFTPGLRFRGQQQSGRGRNSANNPRILASQRSGFGGAGGQGHFNPAFFNQQSGGEGNWNPHGAKRPRPE